MGRVKKLLGLGVIGAVVVPPIGAAIAKRRIVDLGDETSSEVRVAAFFDGRRWTSRSIAFREGSVIAAYSGLDIDLRGAELDPAGGHLDVVALFSGVRVLVPPGWNVAVHTNVAVFGGVQDDTTGAAGAGPVLEVEVRCVFGGVSVTPRDDESAASWTVPAAATRDDAFEQAEAEAAEAAAEEGPEETDPAAGTAEG